MSTPNALSEPEMILAAALRKSIAAMEKCHLDSKNPRPDVCDVCAAVEAARAALAVFDATKETT